MLLFVLLSLFGWVQISDYVRAEFLRNRQLEYVKSARALGLSSAQIIWRHILPNSLTPVITLLPFRISAAILTLASLDFLGLGVTAPAPSLAIAARGKDNLTRGGFHSPHSSWVTATTLLMLTFIGEALRNALDTRVLIETDVATEIPAEVSVELPAEVPA